MAVGGVQINAKMVEVRGLKEAERGVPGYSWDTRSATRTGRQIVTTRPKKSPWASVLAGIFLILGSTLASACEEGEVEAPTQPRLVVPTEVRATEAVDRVVLFGEVHGEVEARVFAQLPEQIEKLHVKEGDRVAAAQPTATLEASLSTSDAQQASAALRAAEARRDQLADELGRIEDLVAQSALPRSRLDSLRAELRAANASVEQLDAGRRAASLRRGRTVVRAPKAGTVALLRAKEGDMAAPNVPLALIVEMDEVIVTLEVVEPDYVRLEEGMAASIKPTALPDTTRSGKITMRSPVIDPLTRTASVEVTVDNEDHLLRPGMTAEVGIELERRKDVVMVPAQAVMMTTSTDEAREAEVFVIDDGKVQRQEIQLGKRYGDRIEVVAGVAAGVRVVLEGQHVLRNGAPVRVAEMARAEGQPPAAEKTGTP